MINKKEFIGILEETGIPVNEAMSSQANTNKFPRIVFWETVWDELDASSSSYGTIVTYQVSVHYRTPRPKELLKLRETLLLNDVRAIMYHEFLEDDKEFHTYFAVDVVENLDE